MMSGNSSAAEADPYTAFDPATFACLQRHLQRGEIPTQDELALVLEANVSAPLPEWFARLARCIAARRASQEDRTATEGRYRGHPDHYGVRALSETARMAAEAEAQPGA